MNDSERKSIVSYLIKDIQIYKRGESENILKSIEFKFPVYHDGKEIQSMKNKLCKWN